MRARTHATHNHTQTNIHTHKTHCTCCLCDCFSSDGSSTSVCEITAIHIRTYEAHKPLQIQPHTTHLLPVCLLQLRAQVHFDLSKELHHFLGLWPVVRVLGDTPVRVCMCVCTRACARTNINACTLAHVPCCTHYRHAVHRTAHTTG